MNAWISFVIYLYTSAYLISFSHTTPFREINQVFLTFIDPKYKEVDLMSFLTEVFGQNMVDIFLYGAIVILSGIIFIIYYKIKNALNYGKSH